MSIIIIEPAETKSIAAELKNVSSTVGRAAGTARRVYNAVQTEEWLTNVLPRVLISEIGEAGKTLQHLADRMMCYSDSVSESTLSMESVDTDKKITRAFSGGFSLAKSGLTGAVAGGFLQVYDHTDDGMDPSGQVTLEQMRKAVLEMKDDSVSMTGWLLDKYDRIPDSVLEEYLNKYPEDGEVLNSALGAIKFTHDVLSGNIDSGTAGSLVKLVGGSSSTASVITHTLDVIFDPNSKTSQMYDKMNYYQNSGIEKLIEGNVGGFLRDEALSFGTGLGGIGVGAVDVMTEMTSGYFDSLGNSISGGLQILGSVVPGENNVVLTLSEIMDTGTNKVTRFFSDLI